MLKGAQWGQGAVNPWRWSFGMIPAYQFIPFRRVVSDLKILEDLGS
jgi:hypothetical protein